MLKLKELFDKMTPEERAEYDLRSQQRKNDPRRRAFDTMISQREILDANYSQAQTTSHSNDNKPTKPL